MNIIEIIKEIILGAILAILLTTVTCHILGFIIPAPIVLKNEKEECEIIKKDTETRNKKLFFSYILIASITISISIFTNIPSLSLGFMGSSFLNIFLAIVSTDSERYIHLVLFSVLLVIVIALIIFRKNSAYES